MNRLATFEAAERTLFESVEIEPGARNIELHRLGCTARVLEFGDGPPIVFVHGVMTAGASWASLAARLPDFRCIMLDRPGCGLSDPAANPPLTLPAQQQLADHLLADVLDGLDLPSAHVVSTSLGGWFAFRSAAAHPDRVQRIVGMGFQGGARIERAPLFMRVQTPPWLAGRVRLPKAVIRSMLKSAGMRGAIESGGFSDEMLNWMVALLNHTETMRNELLTAPGPIGLRGPIDAVLHSPDALARITAPTLLFWGADDPFGGELAAREFADQLPAAAVEIVLGAGHAPWLDQPRRAAEAVRTHLTS